MKPVIRFRSKGKLSPCLVGPFEILERVGLVVYRVALSLSMSKVHNVLNVSTFLKVCFLPFSCGEVGTYLYF